MAWHPNPRRKSPPPPPHASSSAVPRLCCVRTRDAKSAGVKVRVLLLTSPHNPTGRLYSSRALLDAIAWARKRGLHVVVDEVKGVSQEGRGRAKPLSPVSPEREVTSFLTLV